MMAGRLDRTIEVQRLTITLDRAREKVQAWSTVATLRAELVTDTSIETLGDTGAATDEQLTFRTRFADVRTSDRVLYRGEAHDITRVLEIGRRRGLELHCSTRAAR